MLSDRVNEKRGNRDLLVWGLPKICIVSIRWLSGVTAGDTLTSWFSVTLSTFPSLILNQYFIYMFSVPTHYNCFVLNHYTVLLI